MCTLDNHVLVIREVRWSTRYGREVRGALII